MGAAGAGVVIVLLPIVASGYLLYNARLMRALLPDIHRGSDFFRILLLGLLWVLSCEVWLGSSELANADNADNAAAAIDDWGRLAVFGREIPLAEIGVMVLSAFAVRVAIDLFTGPLAPETVKHWINRRMLLNKEAEIMYYEASRAISLLRITTGGDKVHIGYVARMDLPKGDRQWLRIFPVKSGYLDEVGNLHITADYISAQQAGSAPLPGMARPVELLISARDIVAIQTFSIGAYARQEGRASGGGEDSPPA